MRYFVKLKYNGGAYCGWQRQPNAKTVQESIEKALSMLLRQSVEIVGAGRTDSGVHASYYVAHFDFECTEKPLDCEWLKYKLNVILPHDIAIISIEEVSTSLHARFSATEREYTYIIESQKNPFTRHTSWQYFAPLDLEKMNEAAAYLLSVDDFTTFAKLGSDNKTNICDVRHAEWVRRESGEFIFTIRADRFLRNMIRAVVGTLVDVGRGRYSVAEFRDIVDSRDLARSSSSAPAEGLFLSDIKY